MTHKINHCLLLAGAALLIFLTSCGPLPDMVTTEKKGGQKYSADDVRRITVDQPFQMSGDYFRERDQKPNKNLSNLLSSVEKKETPPRKPAEEPSVPESHAVKPTPPAPSLSPTVAAVPSQKKLSFKYAVVMDRAQIGDEMSERIFRVLPAAARGLPVLMADQDRVEEVISRTACSKARDLSCISSALRGYPGIRTLILLEKIRVPDTDSGTMTANISLVDTGLEFRYPVMEVAIPVQGGNLDDAVAGILHQTLAVAVKTNTRMPWFCRAFSEDKSEWYITAGGKSGLQPGMRLKVVKSGKMIKSPTGLPAGWVEGETKGMLKVKQLFGEDFAVCVLESGSGPDSGELLLLP